MKLPHDYKPSISAPRSPEGSKEPPICPAQTPSNVRGTWFCCTLPKGHAGDHRTFDRHGLRKQWSAAPTPPDTPRPYDQGEFDNYAPAAPQSPMGEIEKAVLDLEDAAEAYWGCPCGSSGECVHYHTRNAARSSLLALIDQREQVIWNEAHAHHSALYRDEIESLRSEIESLRKTQRLYDELLYQVVKKHPNESRHETALRYIRQAEAPSNNAAEAKSSLAAPTMEGDKEMKRGFTMVEVLVSVCVIGVLAAVVIPSVMAQVAPPPKLSPAVNVRDVPQPEVWALTVRASNGAVVFHKEGKGCKVVGDFSERAWLTNGGLGPELIADVTRPTGGSISCERIR